MHRFAYELGFFVLAAALGVVLTIAGVHLEDGWRHLEGWLADRWAWRRRRCAACGRPVRNAPTARIRAGEAFGSTDRTGRFVCWTCHGVHVASPTPRVTMAPHD